MSHQDSEGTPSQTVHTMSRAVIRITEERSASGDSVQIKEPDMILKGSPNFKKFSIALEAVYDIL